MCGIFGEFGHSLLNKETFLNINSLSKKRGPDMSGYWSDNNICQLGFNRLSILDLTKKGNQPMVSSNENWVMVMNGEVYNYPEIREKLGKSKGYYSSRTDSEVVLSAFEIWGVSKTLKNLNGIFAIGLYDKQNSRIHLIRDFAGVKPLYFGIYNNTLVFASQYDQIFTHPEIKKKLTPNHHSLTDFVRLGYIPSPNAFFKGTGQVDPGQVISFDRDCNITKYTYYYYTQSGVQYKETNNCAIKKLDKTLFGAVSRQLGSDVPVGSFLSGGIDSPLICNYINENNPDYETFTIGTLDADFDESSAAIDYANYLGVKNNLYQYTDAMLIKDLNNHFKAYSEPFGDYSSLPSYHVCKMAKTKFKVVLSGDGGDELFWGYPRFLRFATHFHWFNMKLPYREYLAFIIRKMGMNLSYGLSAESIQDWVFTVQSHNNIDIINKLLPGNSNSDKVKELYGPSIPITNQIELLHWLRNNEFYGHLQRVLLKMDRASMYHGLEVRVPFLDRNVLDYSQSIEPELNRKHKIPKYMLKHIMKKKYPQHIVQENKMGFDFNLYNALNGVLKDEVLELLVARDPYPKNTFNRIEMNNYVNSFYKKEHYNAWGLWILYALQKWADSFELYN